MHLKDISSELRESQVQKLPYHDSSQDISNSKIG